MLVDQRVEYYILFFFYFLDKGERGMEIPQVQAYPVILCINALVYRKVLTGNHGFCHQI